MLLTEWNDLFTWINGTVKPDDANGQVPLGVVTTDTADLQANFNNGEMVATISGIRINLNTALATGARVFTDSDGTEISTYP